MPQRMLGQMEAVAAQQLEDEEKFRKIQVVDQTNFDDQLDTLNVSWTKQFLFFLNSKHISKARSKAI